MVHLWSCCIQTTLCGESLNEVMDKYERWKNAVKGKDLRVNVDNKTNGMQLLFGKKRWILAVSGVNRLAVILIIV